MPATIRIVNEYLVTASDPRPLPLGGPGAGEGTAWLRAGVAVAAVGDGLPIGLMLVGRHYEEPDIYRAAQVYEQRDG